MRNVVKVWTLTIPEGGKPTYGAPLEYSAGEIRRLSDVFRTCKIDPDKVEFISYKGVRYSPEDTVRVYEDGKIVRAFKKALHEEIKYRDVQIVETIKVNPGDEENIYIVPKLEGKHANIIVGVIGIVAAIAITVVTGGFGAAAGWALASAAMQVALVGYAIGSAIGTLMMPKPRNGKDGGAQNSYLWNGISNEASAGSPVPLAFGEHKTGPVRVGMFLRRENGKEVLYLLYLVSKGQIQAINDVRVNGQPYTNFPGVTIDTRLGLPSQTAIPGFDVIANTFPLSQDLTVAPYIHTTQAGKLVSSAEVLLSLPGLFHVDNGNNLKSNSTLYTIEYRVFGGSTWTPVTGFNPKTTTASSRSLIYDTVRVNFPTPGRYDIRCTWLTALQMDATKDGWKVFLTGVTEEQQKTGLTYDTYAMLAVKAVAMESLSGGIPLVTCVPQGILCEQVTSGGSLTAASYSRNRAWSVLKLFRDTKVGAGAWVTDDDLDLQSFYDWSVYLDTLTTVQPADGSASFTEPFDQFDTIITNQTRFLDLIIDICAGGRATPVMSGNKWKIVIDRPGPIRQQFGMGNIVKGSFQLRYSGEGERVNTYDVNIMDRANDWNDTPFRVVSKQQVTILGKPVRAESLALYGITRRSQAQRDALFRLNSLHYLRRVCQFLAYTDAIAIEVGDLIGVSHDIPQWGFSGRAKSGTTTSIRLDQPITIQAGHTYEVLVRYQNGSNGAGTLCTVTNAPGVTDTLTFASGSLPTAPARNDIYAFGETGVSYKPYRVVSISRTGDNMRRIIGVEYNASLYDTSGDVQIINYSALPNFMAPPPALTSMDVYEELGTRTDLGRRSTLIVSWNRPLITPGKGVFEGCKVERSYDGGTTWETAAPYVIGTEWRWPDAPQLITIGFRVTPRSTMGVFNNAGALTTFYTVTGWTTRPAAVAGVTTLAKDGVFIYTWGEVARAIEYEIRTADTNWGVDQNFIFRGRAQKYSLSNPSARAVTLYVRAVDEHNNYSATSTVMTCTDAAPGAPTVFTGNIIKTKDNIKIPVGPPAGSDIQALYLHASTTSGFTPSSANRVAQTLGSLGGDFILKPSSTATIFFRVTATDNLTDRFNDYVYTAEFNSSLFSITPVNPSGVTFAESVTPTRRRAVAPPSSGGTTAPSKIFSLFVNWTFVDSVNPAGHLKGFQVVVYPTSTGSPINNTFDSGLLPEPTQRSCGIDGMTIDSAANYTAAVRAIYAEDDISSSWITSTGLALDPVTGESALQNLDDRNLSSFGESFDGGFMPIGFTRSGTDVPFVGLSALFIAPTNVSDTWIQWDCRAWGNAYLDVQRGNAGFKVLIAVASNGATNPNRDIPVTFNNGSGGITTKTFRFDPTLPIHTYVVDFTSPAVSFPSTLGVSPTIKVDFSGVFTGAGSPQWYIPGIAVSFDDVTFSVDGHVSRALRARDQFDKNPSFGGFFLKSPIRQSNAPDNTVQVYESGGYYIVNVNGVEYGYKRGRQGRMSSVFNSTIITYGSSIGRFLTSGVGDVSPVIPAPFASNKARVGLNIANGGSIISTTPLAYPVRPYVEACEIADATFRLAVAEYHGGSMNRSTTILPSGQSAATGRPLVNYNTLTPPPPSGSNTNSAWCAVTGSIPVLSPAAHCYRAVLWLKVTMPNIQKTTGSYYGVDLSFYVHGGIDSGTGTAPLQLSFSHSYTKFVGRFRTDGTTDYYPIIISGVRTDPLSDGAGTNHNQRTAQNYRVDWVQQVNETGSGTVTPTVELDRVDVDYMSGYAGVFYPSGSIALDYLFVEEN